PSCAVESVLSCRRTSAYQGLDDRQSGAAAEPTRQQGGLVVATLPAAIRMHRYGHDRQRSADLQKAAEGRERRDGQRSREARRSAVLQTLQRIADRRLVAEGGHRERERLADHDARVSLEEGDCGRAR